jgi:hypothetical protein
MLRYYQMIKFILLITYALKMLFSVSRKYGGDWKARPKGIPHVFFSEID